MQTFYLKIEAIVVTNPLSARLAKITQKVMGVPIDPFYFTMFLDYVLTKIYQFVFLYV